MNFDRSETRNELERRARGLRRYARALVARDASDPVAAADELTRETLTRAARAGHPAAGKIWLYATLTSLNRARLRRRGDAPPSPAAQTPGITSALSALPLDDREPLLLVVVEGFTYAEAADALGLPRAAIMMRMARARAVLENHLSTTPPDARGKANSPPYLRVVK